MRILCDTSSVLMVIRIVPDMFVDPNFKCVTTPNVRHEIFKTQKFKTKYPWREEYKSKIVAIGNSALQTKDMGINISAIDMLTSTGVLNSKTGQLIDLSLVDKEIVACAAAYKYNITSGDGDLIDFAEQQFDISNITPLGLLNDWLEEGLIVWDAHMQMVIEDWDKCKEKGQPVAEIGRYQTLTHKLYKGP